MALKIVTSWFVLLTALALFTPDDILFGEIFYGVVFIWILYGVFRAGFMLVYERGDSSYNEISDVSGVHQSYAKTFLFSCVIIGASVISSRYYTGSGFSDVLGSIGSQQNLYAEYQAYFRSENIRVFSIEKIPFILCLIFIKFYMLVAFSSVATSTRIHGSVAISLFSAILAHLYFSVARGTSFEVFEVALLSVLVYVIRAQRVLNRSLFTARGISFIVGFSVLAVSIYSYNIGLRGGEAGCTLSEICVNKSSFFHQLSPGLGDTIYRLGTYFIFGIYFISQSLIVIFDDINSVIHFLFPGGAFIFYGGDFKETMCAQHLNCGVSWVPDIMRLLSSLGFIFFFIVTYCSGVVIGHLEKRLSRATISPMLLYLLLVYFIMSLPVGKFITTSSANTASIFLGCVLFISHRARRTIVKNLGLRLAFNK